MLELPSPPREEFGIQSGMSPLCWRSADAYDVVVVVVGGGGGGGGADEALVELLARLPAAFPVPIAIMLHRDVFPMADLVNSLQSCTRLQVKEATDNETMRPGTVYLARPSYYLLVCHPRSFSTGPIRRANVRYATADPLFLSAAIRFGRRSIGVVLSGSGEDGAAGAHAIHRAGGAVLVQSEASCKCYEMPRATLSRVCADFILPPVRLAGALLSLTMTAVADTESGLFSEDMLKT